MLPQVRGILTIRARSKITLHFIRRYIPPGCVAKTRNMPDIPAFSRLAGRAPQRLKLRTYFFVNPKEGIMAFFGKKSKEMTEQRCKEMVEDFLNAIGVDPNKSRLEGEDMGWHIVRGSALTYIFIGVYDDFKSLRIFSPILYLPEENILPFYRRCLEINFELINCAICVRENKVALVVERPLEGLDPEELEGMVEYMSRVADELDNKMSDEFGAKIFSQQG
jgi:type III secretion system-like peptide-binding chaperone